MALTSFPSVETADEDGLLALGGDLEPASILLAYRNGIFPWPLNDGLVGWFAPPQRAVLYVDEFHLSRTTRKELARARFTSSMDRDFRGVMERCAEVTNRGTQGSTWITHNMIEAYSRLFSLGWCHSVETYLDGELVGGLYGVQIGGFFAAESSFYRISSASKAAMVHLVEYLRHEGITWFDCQVLTAFSRSFGAREIPRHEFMTQLAQALSR